MGTPDMGMVIRAGKLWTTWGKIEACMTRKETPERSHQRIHAAGSGVTLLSCLPLGLIIKKENESFMNKWVQTEKIIKVIREILIKN